MGLIFKIVKLVMRVLGFIERVQAHTRMNGIVKVAAYWRRA
jgi:hypothetical protein